MLDQERNFVCPHFEHRACTFYVARTVSEAGVEEPRIVNSKLTIGRIKGDHFCGEVRGNADLFPGCEKVKVTCVKDEALISSLIARVPKFLGRVVIDPIQFDYR